MEEERVARATFISTCAFVVYLVGIVYFLPSVFENIDDPTIAMVLQGEHSLQIAPDAHSVFVHYALGWIVSRLSARFPSILWYGVVVCGLYIAALTVIGCNLPGVRGSSSAARRAAIFAAFVAAFAILPLLIFQFTILAGLLALAGMLTCVRYVLFRESCSKTMWMLGTLCVALGMMVRIQMAAVVIAACIPALAVSFFHHLDKRRAGGVLAYLVVLAGIGLGLHYVDRSHYSSPPYARLVDWVRLLNEYTAYPSKHPFRAVESARVGWSANDYGMFLESMGLDTGPFRVEVLRRLYESSKEGAMREEESGTRDGTPQAPKKPKLWIQEKFDRLVQRQHIRDILRAVYLLVILGAGITLTICSVIVADWERAEYLVATACSVATFYLLTVVVLDRPVFRVILPLAYVFFVIAVIVFPWSRLTAGRPRTPWRRAGIVAAMSLFGLMGLVGVIVGTAQCRANWDQQELFRGLMRSIRAATARGQPIVAWPDALPLQYQSPFKAMEEVRNTVIYHVTGTYSSYPARVKRFEERFGEDIYAGFLRNGVLHLVSSEEQIQRLKSFAAEHYARKISGVQLATFQVAYRDLTLWEVTD